MQDDNFLYLEKVDYQFIREALLGTVPPPQLVAATTGTRDRLNVLAQSVLNAHSSSLGNVRPKLEKYRLNDPVICAFNAYEHSFDGQSQTETSKLLVARGTLGTIQYLENKTVVVYNNGYHDVCQHNGFRSLFDLAYCLTLDVTQGSEYDGVCFIVDGNRPGTPKHLYSPISRAKSSCVVMGTPENIRNLTRYQDALDECLLNALNHASKKRRKLPSSSSSSSSSSASIAASSPKRSKLASPRT